MPTFRLVLAAAILWLCAADAVAQTPQHAAARPASPAEERERALSEFRLDLQHRAREQLALPFDYELVCSDTDPVMQSWNLKTTAIISDQLDNLGVGPPDDPLAQLVEWSRTIHVQLLDLTQAAIAESGIDPLFDPEMDFEFGVLTVVRSPDTLEPLDPSSVTAGGIRQRLSRRDEERLHGGRLARVRFEGLDLVWASDWHTTIQTPRPIPQGARLTVEIRLDSDRLSHAAPLAGHLIVTNTGTRRHTASRGSLLAGMRITSPDGADAPRHHRDGRPSLRDWAETIILLPGESHEEAFVTPTRAAPRPGYMLTPGEWVVTYDRFPLDPPCQLEFSPVVFDFLPPITPSPSR
jgi:hypothetical protein